MPVAYEKLRTLPRDIALVAFAGPLANFILIVISAILFNITFALPLAWQEPFAKMISISIAVNTILALFNLLPIPPLDGSKILMALGPRSPWRSNFQNGALWHADYHWHSVDDAIVYAGTRL